MTRHGAVLIHGVRTNAKTAAPFLHDVKAELEARDFRVQMPDMPNAWSPGDEGARLWRDATISAIKRLKRVEALGTDLEDVHLCGHSAGGLSLLGTAQGFEPGTKVGSLTLVATPYVTTRWKGFLRSFLPPNGEHFDIDKIRAVAKSITVITSRDDYMLDDPEREAGSWARDLGAKLYLVDRMRHFSAIDSTLYGVNKNPWALMSILRASGMENEEPQKPSAERRRPVKATVQEGPGQ